MLINKLVDLFNLLKTDIDVNTMIIGMNMMNPKDIIRNIKADIVMDQYDLSAEGEVYKKIGEKYIIFNYNFNCLNVISNAIIMKYNDINKLTSIIFDTYTFKFLNKIRTIAIFYYIILQEGGSIYIESNSGINTIYHITTHKQLDIFENMSEDGFIYPIAYKISEMIDTSKYEKNYITNSNQIYKNNIEFLKQTFYGSNVELLHEGYPIENETYPITTYYKITKNKRHDEILEYLKINLIKINKQLNLQKHIFVKNDFNF